MSAIVEINNLIYSYTGEKNTLDGVSFSIESGSYVCLIGHNGSGKSTLAKAIIGLLTGPRKGEITLFGEKASKKNIGQLRSRIGIVFQNPDNQFVGSTVADDIAFGLENGAVPHDKMVEIVEEFAKATGMEKEMGSEPSSLSGGQKQRVAIAGVLAMAPDLIILDEATSMLDPKGKREIDGLIHQIKASRPELTILSITHDLEEACHADEVIVLNEGKVLLSGEPSVVFQYEEELHSAHLEVPFLYRIKAKLKKRGLDVPSHIKTVEELEEYLCR